MILAMKTVSKINPELEYKIASTLIDRALENPLDSKDHIDLKNSVDNLMTATKVLMERENRRRGYGNNRKKYKNNNSKPK